MICSKCGKAMFAGASGYTDPQCQCGSTKRYHDDLDELTIFYIERSKRLAQALLDISKLDKDSYSEIWTVYEEARRIAVVAIAATQEKPE